MAQVILRIAYARTANSAALRTHAQTIIAAMMTMSSLIRLGPSTRLTGAQHLHLNLRLYARETSSAALRTHVQTRTIANRLAAVQAIYPHPYRRLYASTVWLAALLTHVQTRTIAFPHLKSRMNVSSVGSGTEIAGESRRRTVRIAEKHEMSHASCATLLLYFLYLNKYSSNFRLFFAVKIIKTVL